MAIFERLAAGGGPNLFEREDYSIEQARPEEFQAWENTVAFLNEVSSAKTNRFGTGYYPLLKRYNGDRRFELFDRKLEIAGLYVGTGLSQAKIAERYKVSTSRINTIFHGVLRTLYGNADPAIKDKYPWFTLGTRKPHGR